MAELFEAIKSGDGATVDRLLERDRALVDARDETGLSPVLVALYRGKGEIAASILRRRPILNVFEASATGDLRRVRELAGSACSREALSQQSRTATARPRSTSRESVGTPRSRGCSRSARARTRGSSGRAPSRRAPPRARLSGCPGRGSDLLPRSRAIAAFLTPRASPSPAALRDRSGRPLPACPRRGLHRDRSRPCRPKGVWLRPCPRPRSPSPGLRSCPFGRCRPS